MNLALHGFLLHVLLSILNLQHGSLLCSAGEPGYLDFDNLPETNFSCQGKVIGGYYADVEAGCQMFHVCTIGQKDEIMDIKFLCLNGTVFDQETRVCERVDEVDCSKSEKFYNLNLELYGNNAVTLSLHENTEDEIDSSDSGEERQRSTSTRPTTTTTTTTTTSKPIKQSTTPASSSFSHPTGYPQHFQPQPPFPQVHTSQSKSLYDDKNGGYHHQYIFHNGERNNNQQATSYQLFSSQGVGSTTVQPLQVHQIRYSSTSSPQIIHNEPSTVTPLFHATSSTIQTLLNSNGNSPSLINPIFHNHGIASTTEQFSVHSNNPRETSEYRENEQSIRPLETAQSTNKGKVSKLTLSSGSTADSSRSVQTKTSSQSSQQQRISGNFLPTPTTDETTVRSFYPTPRASTKSSQTSQSTSEQVTQHIHVLPPVQIPQLKPHQITINIPPPPDLQRIVQNPSSLLPSQSRVIVTAKASVSDESGRPLNTTQLVTLPLPTIPASYDDYKEGDESFDPFYRDVPKIRSNRRVPRRVRKVRTKRSVGQTKNSMVSFVYGGDSKRKQDVQTINASEEVKIDSGNDEFKSIKESLIKFRDILFGGEFTDEVIRNLFEGSRVRIGDSGGKTKNLKRDLLEDLEPRASKNFKMKEHGEKTKSEGRKTERHSESLEVPVALNTKASDADEYIDVDKNEKIEKSMNDEMMEEKNVKVETSEELKEPEEIVDVVIFDPNEYLKSHSIGEESTSNITEREQITTEVPILSSTESTTKGTAESYSKSSENKNDAEEPKMLGQEKTLREENKNERLEEPRRNTRRKNSRVRVSRPKSSVRKKESMNTNNESAKLLDKIPEENVEMNSKIEQIDKHIFEEKESHNSKEVDTRAVNNRYSKNLQTGKDQKVEKENRKIDNEYQILEKQFKSLEDTLNDKERTTVLPSKKKELEEEKKIEETESDEVEYPETAKKNVSVEEKTFYDEESSMEYESMENESTTIFSNENSEDDQKRGSNHSKKNVTLKNSSIEVSSYVESKSKEIDDEEEEKIESYEYSTMKSEEINSEEVSSEYLESTESFDDSTHEMDENYKHFRSSEDTIASSEHTYSDETENSKEEVQKGDDKDESSLSDQEESTEGVLKFTDELPKDRKEDVSENKKSSESDESIDLDYVDDNYEPENYKGRESSDSNSVSNEKVNMEMMSDAKADTNEENDEDESETTTESESSENKETETPMDFSTEKTDLLQTTTSTTTTTTTTTTRSTPPKLFKPISARKIYTYIPPTTTPKPVVIKPRPSLLNPKPAKPPKSYSELAPKPVIRKFPLLSRKPSTFAPITTVKDEDFPETTEIMTTEAVTINTEATKSEEKVLESKLEPVNITEKEDQAPIMNKQDQDSILSEQKSPENLKKEEDQSFIPYPISKLSSPSAVDETLKEVNFSSAEFEKQMTTPISSTFTDLEVMSTTVLPMTFTSNEPENSTELFSSTMKTYIEEETSSTSSTKSMVQDATEIPVSSTPEAMITPETTTKKIEEAEPTTMRPLNRMSTILRRQGGFNCLEKEMYRFYGDSRDCRLFHYCSPGFTSRQVLDFRFVCEEGTVFDEESQSCRHDVRNRKCVNRRW